MPSPLVTTLACGDRVQVTEVTETFKLMLNGRERYVCLATTDLHEMVMWDMTTHTALTTFKGYFNATPKRITFVPGSNQSRVVVTGYENTMVVVDLTNWDNDSNQTVCRWESDTNGTVVGELLVDIPSSGRMGGMSQTRLLTCTTSGELHVWNREPITWNTPRMTGVSPGSIAPELTLRGHAKGLVVNFMELNSGRTAQTSSALR